MRQGATIILAALAWGATLEAPRRGLGAEPPALPDSRLGIRTAPLLLLSRPDVRADLALDPKQAAEARREINALYLKASALRGKTGNEAIASRRAIDLEQETWLETQLTEAQRVRLGEIDLQWEGPSALVSRPKVVEALGLSRQQSEELERAVVEAARKGDWRAAQPELARRALSILSAPQRERWRVILGREFAPQLAGAGGTARR